MAKSIIDYQNAYKEITELLKKNNNILSIFIFGSMVSGDLWEGSNIDLFVIYKEDFHEIRDVYSEVSGIPIHIKIISKELFKKYYNEAGKREFIKNSLISSKMIYSIDDEITDLYQKIIYMIDYMENYLEYNIEKASMDLINFIKNENRSLSAYDIKINPYFKNFKIKIEEILKVLYKNNIITQEKRELRDSKGNFLAMENVYSYKN
jgi:predicted nucleotidyltransferase